MASKLSAVRNRFCIGEPPEAFTQFDRVALGLPTPLDDAAKTFRSNVMAAINVASIPFMMACRAENDFHFNRFFTAARIRALTDVEPGAPLSAEQEKAAFDLARSQFGDFAKENRETIGVAILDRLDDIFSDEEMTRSGNELLAETLVMLWGALETFLLALSRTHVNKRPEVAVWLLTSEQTKKHFPAKGIAIETLSDFGFRVDGAMGDLLFREDMLDSLPVVRDIFAVMFRGVPDTQRCLANEKLWTIWQQRHLVVHKRGVVDSHYISKTGHKQAVGTRLEITGENVDEAVCILVNAATECLAAAKAEPQEETDQETHEPDGRGPTPPAAREP